MPIHESCPVVRDGRGLPLRSGIVAEPLAQRGAGRDVLDKAVERLDRNGGVDGFAWSDRLLGQL